MPFKINMKMCDPLSVEIDDEGYILFKQYDHNVGEDVIIRLSPSQFDGAANWIFRYKNDIKNLWNDGREVLKGGEE